MSEQLKGPKQCTACRVGWWEAAMTVREIDALGCPNTVCTQARRDGHTVKLAFLPALSSRDIELGAVVPEKGMAITKTFSRERRLAEPPAHLHPKEKAAWRETYLWVWVEQP